MPPRIVARGLFLPSLIQQSPWARRFADEMVDVRPGGRHATKFNVGLAPVHAEILADPATTADVFQIQLYAELFSLAGQDAEALRRSAVIEVAAAGCERSHRASRAVA